MAIIEEESTLRNSQESCAQLFQRTLEIFQLLFQNQSLRRELSELQDKPAVMVDHDKGYSIKPFSGDPQGTTYQAWIRQFEAKTQYHDWTVEQNRGN